MPYNNLHQFVQALEQSGELKRVAYPVKPELEIAEIADRVMKNNGPALLFENVTGKKMPVLINAFGSRKRMAMALGVNNIDEIAEDIARLTQMKPPGSFWDKLRMLPELARLGTITPKTVKAGECQEVIQRAPDL